MRDCFKEPLIDPTWEQIVERDSLMAFSKYLSGRVHVLLAVADEIVESLDRGFSEERVNGGQVERAESLLWLWMFGAYEVVRTMCQTKTCFSEKAFDEPSRLKKALSVVRMPATKMEKPGRKEPVTADRSPSGWDVAKRNLLVNDPDAGSDISARSILAEFDRVFSSIKNDDVIARHEDSYSGGPNKPLQTDGTSRRR